MSRSTQRGALVLAIGMVAAGCQAILGIHDVEQDPGGTGGTAATSSSTSMTSTSTASSSSTTSSTGGGGAAPTAPSLVTPLNNAYVGGIHVAGSMRPKFSWSKSSGMGAIHYVVEIDKDPGFPAPIKSPDLTTTSWQPATDLAVSTVQPVGDRLYWRVKACVGADCATSTSTRWVNVGRPLGDIDGDGFDDFLVGYPTDPSPAMKYKLGSVRVFPGAAGKKFPAMQSKIVYAPIAEESYELGHTVITADVNGDGYADVISGGAGLNGKGRLYVFFGSKTGIKDAPDVEIARPKKNFDNGHMGTPLARAGDVNGDGYMDIIAGAPPPTDAGPLPGEAFVFLGGPSFDGKTYVELSGITDSDYFGQSVAGAGDLDGDGYDDVLVGVPMEVGGGVVRVFRGTANGLDASPSDNITIGGAMGIGNVVSSAGDMNGDGNADLLFTSNGSAYVFFGAAKGKLSATPDWTVTLAGANAAATTLEDADEDGFADIALGVPNDGSNGHVAVFTGGNPPDTIQDGKLDRAGGTATLGTVLGVGDWNGDGRLDLVTPRSGLGLGGIDLDFFQSEGSYPAGTFNPQTEAIIPNVFCFN